MSIGKIKWQTIVSKYAYPETWRSLWQVAQFSDSLFCIVVSGISQS